MMRGCRSFYLLQFWLRKFRSQTEINSLSRKIVVSPPNPIYKPKAQMSRGKSKVYLKKEVILEEEELDGDWSHSQLQKETVFSDTYQGWGALTEQ